MRKSAKYEVTSQTSLSSTLSGSGLTSSKVDMLELKRNPGQFGEQEDGATGLGVQVEIEFHHV